MASGAMFSSSFSVSYMGALYMAQILSTPLPMLNTREAISDCILLSLFNTQPNGHQSSLRCHEAFLVKMSQRCDQQHFVHLMFSATVIIPIMQQITLNLEPDIAKSGFGGGAITSLS